VAPPRPMVALAPPGFARRRRYPRRVQEPVLHAKETAVVTHDCFTAAPAPKKY